MVLFDFNAFVAQTSEKLKSPEVQLASAGIVGTVTAVQLFTDWNPLGRCFVFWKQLRAHVSLITTMMGYTIRDISRKLFYLSICVFVFLVTKSKIFSPSSIYKQFLRQNIYSV